MVPAILRNDDAEALILDIRAGRTAVGQRVGERAGAFLIFATSVVTSGRPRGQVVYPLTSDAEPGSLVTAPGTAQIAAVVAGVTVTGTFHWTVGGGDAPPAQYSFRRRGREMPAPPWADQLPRSQALTGKPRPALIRQQVRLQRGARTAEHWLFALSEQVIRQSCRGPIGRAIDYRPVIDVDDVVQRGLQTAARLLPLYASKDRPPCSWLGMLHLDSRRDMYREVSRLDWLPTEAVAAVTLADAFGVRRQSDPSATLRALVAAADHLGCPRPRIAALQLDAALRAPILLAQEAVAAATIAGPDPGDHDGATVAARVARLVTDDVELIARAATTDGRALDQIGDQVVRRLRDGRESSATTRRRCWDQFRQSGQLFTSPAGLDRFADAADPLSLATLDECLGRAAGVLRCSGEA